MTTQNAKNNLQIPEQVVHYYNLYKLDNKDNKDNKYAEETSADIENTCGSLRSGLASLSASQDIPIQVGQVVSGDNIPDEVLPILNEDMISRAIIQFFDNEGQKQRYKIKIRFNLVDKENPEFIATLTKDWSNFKKYIPTECKDHVMESAREFRAHIKKTYDTIPYMGKFHLNTGKQQGTTRGFTNIEPWTFVFVWFDSVNSQWQYAIQFYDFHRNGTFDETYITAAQKRVGVKSQDLYINPKYDQVKRPKTWAQQRSEKRATK
jgi:hypothetical protein